MTKLDANKWSQYWEHDTITTLGDMFPDNYDESFAEFWQQQLENGPRQIIDLACGNGALVWLVHELFAKEWAEFDITGVDYANINPFAILGRKAEDYPGVRFIGNTSIEQLPFADVSVDHVISQYGVEYANLEKVAAELNRVLKPSGKMSFILHDENSDLLKSSTKDLDTYKWILNDIRVHENFSDLERLCKKHTDFSVVKQKPAVQKKMAEIKLLNQSIKLKAQALQTVSVLDHYLRPMFSAFSTQGFADGVDRKKAIKTALRSLQTYVARIDDLKSAALSEEELEQFIVAIEGYGFKVLLNQKIAYKANKNMGTALVARRT
jgi:SAM-dependent methyltransferase